MDAEPDSNQQLTEAAERARQRVEKSDEGIEWNPPVKTVQSAASEYLNRLRPLKPVVELTEEQKAERLLREEAWRAEQELAEQRREHSRRCEIWDGIKTTLGTKHADCKLSNYEFWGPDETRKAQQENVGKLREYMADFDNKVASGTNIVWTGTRGTGKDHLMAACLKAAVLGKGKRARWMYGPNLFLALRGLMSKNSKETESDLIRTLSGTPILALSDPLPTIGGLTPYQADALLTIVDERYRNQKPIWVTLNVESREDAEARLGGLLVDRLFENSLILFSSWPSYRQYTQTKAMEASNATR